jgi:hypothetical protein
LLTNLDGNLAHLGWRGAHPLWAAVRSRAHERRTWFETRQVLRGHDNGQGRVPESRIIGWVAARRHTPHGERLGTRTLDHLDPNVHRRPPRADESYANRRAVALSTLRTSAIDGGSANRRSKGVLRSAI